MDLELSEGAPRYVSQRLLVQIHVDSSLAKLNLDRFNSPDSFKFNAF